MDQWVSILHSSLQHQRLRKVSFGKHLFQQQPTQLARYKQQGKKLIIDSLDILARVVIEKHFKQWYGVCSLQNPPSLTLFEKKVQCMSRIFVAVNPVDYALKDLDS